MPQEQKQYLSRLVFEDHLRCSRCPGTIGHAMTRGVLRGAGWIIAVVATGLAGLAAGAQTIPAFAAQQQGQVTEPGVAEFAVASVRVVPERERGLFSMSRSGAELFTMRNTTLSLVIAWAFGVDLDRVSGGPDWINDQEYDISARPEGDMGLTYEQVRPLVQQLLRDRFHLVYHRGTKDIKGYALVVSGKALKLTPTKGDAPRGYWLVNRICDQDASVSDFAGMLTGPLKEPVVDKTGLKGNYDFDIKYSSVDTPDLSFPSLFTAIEELGLKLVRQKDIPVEALVIEQVSRSPTPN